MIKNIVIACLCLTICHAAKIPSFFTKCKKNDPTTLNSCIFDNIKKGYDQFAKGDNAYHLQSLSPLKVPKLYIDVNGGLSINLTDITIIGFDNAIFTNVSIDLDQKVLKLHFNSPVQLICLAQYSISGRILILPVVGNGPLNTTFVEPDVHYTITYEIEKHGNKEYIVPKTNTFAFTVTRIYFGLENLFNGDKRLGDEMKKFLDENWKEVNGEIGVKLGDALGEVLMHVLKAFLGKIPYNELIDE